MEDDPTGGDQSRGPGGPLRTVLRPLVRWLRRVAQRVAHPWRRKRAIELLHRLRPVRSVVFICLGNICRSPYAAAVLATAEPHLEIRSAGLLRGGRACPPEAIEAAGRLGPAMTRHVSRRADAEGLRDVDLVVVMDPRQREALLERGLAHPDRILVLGDLDPDDSGSRTITDPYGADLALFNKVYHRIDRCLEVLRAQLA